jgi:methyl-accepting chemotaxis protein
MMNLTRAFDEQVKGMVETLANAARGMEADRGRSHQDRRCLAAESPDRRRRRPGGAGRRRDRGVGFEELSASISEISRQVTNQATLAQTSVNSIEATSRSVAELSDASQKIGEWCVSSTRSPSRPTSWP